MISKLELLIGIRQLSEADWHWLQDQAENHRRMDAIRRFCEERCSLDGPASYTEICDTSCPLSPHSPTVCFGGGSDN